MDSDRSHMLISAGITLVATVMITVLRSHHLLDDTIRWFVAFALFGFAVAGWHHKRVHRTFLLDATILSMAASVAVFAAILTTIVVSSFVMPFSSLNAHLVLVTVVFVVSLVGTFVLARLASVRSEPNMRILKHAAVTAAVLSIIAVVSFQIAASMQFSSQFEQFETQQPSPIEPARGLMEDYASLDGEPIIDAYDLASEQLLRELRSFEPDRSCEQPPVRIDRCIDEVTDTIVYTVDYVISSLVLSSVLEHAANVSVEPDAALSGAQVASILGSAYHKPHELESLSVGAAVRYAERYDASGGPAAGQLELFTGGTTPVEDSVRTIALSTSAGDELAQLVVRVLDLTTHYSEHQPLVGLALLLEADPNLADDPRFATVALERLDESDVRT